MPIDGCFIHYLTKELNNSLNNGLVNKIYQPTPHDIIFQIRKKNGERSNFIQLLLSCRLDMPRVHITNKKYQNPETPTNFCMVLRKYLEHSKIISINQYHNDRILEFSFSAYTELQDLEKYIIIIELMGRNSNIILLNKDYVIIDALRKLPPSLDNMRTIIPHAKYAYPISMQKNPFNEDILDNLDEYEGFSKQLKIKLASLDVSSRKSFLTSTITPNIYIVNNKKDFYAFDINDNVIATFNTLSDMLDAFYDLSTIDTNYAALNMEKKVNSQLKKLLKKKSNLEDDLSKANENLKYNELGILLQANLYLIKKGDKSITLNNWLKNNEEVTIILDPMLDPSKNLKKIFSIGKKAKTALEEIAVQMKIVDNEIEYLNNILFQLSICSHSEIDDIKLDLIKNHYLSSSPSFKTNKKNIKILTYEVNGASIYVGKNNLQNEYLTTKFARSYDYWFHAKDMPGSHVIVKLNNNISLNEEIIRSAANLASYFSKGKTSSSVPVDYTLIKYIKKIPGTPGYHVTYTNQKTIYIDPDFDLISKYNKVNF